MLAFGAQVGRKLSDIENRDELIQQLGKQIAEMVATFYETANKSDLPDSQRIEAATQFVDLQKNDSAASKLLDLITPKTTPELARGLIDALGHSEAMAIGVALADRLPQLTPAVRQNALRVLMSRTLGI